MFDYKTNDYFALINPIPGGWSFTSYTFEGETYRAINGFNRDGVARNFVVFFGDRERVFTCPKKKLIDVIVNNNVNNLRQMKLSEYLEKSGYCTGPNCTSAIFKKIDEVKDAKEMVDVKTFRIEQEALAVGLKGEELKEMANLLGEFSDDKNLQKRAVLEFAGKQPDDFKRIYEDPSRTMKSTIQKALKMGILKQKGKVVTWDKDVIGSGEEQWVDYFTKEKEKFAILKETVRAFK